MLFVKMPLERVEIAGSFDYLLAGIAAIMHLAAVRFADGHAALPCGNA